MHQLVRHSLTKSLPWLDLGCDPIKDQHHLMIKAQQPDSVSKGCHAMLIKQSQAGSILLGSKACSVQHQRMHCWLSQPQGMRQARR
jgi:hypothetical protein